MIRIPGQGLGLLGKRLQDWESWTGSLVRLVAAHSELCDQVCEVGSSRQLHDALRQAQEAISDLQDRIHKTWELFEGGDVSVGRSFCQIFDHFSVSFDTRCIESLHLSAVENDVHRLSLNGTLSPAVIPGVRVLDLLPRGGSDDGL